MAIKLGNLDISSFKVGSGDCSIYLGSTLLYSGGTPPTPTEYALSIRWSDDTYYLKECGDSSFNIYYGLFSSIGHDRSEARDVVVGSCYTNSFFRSAFADFSGALSFTINIDTPPTCGGLVFDNTNNAPIYVPSESVTAYKAASGWSTYADRIQAIPNS